MVVGFLPDVSSLVGLGHVFRLFRLAEAFSEFSTAEIKIFLPPHAGTKNYLDIFKSLSKYIIPLEHSVANQPLQFEEIKSHLNSKADILLLDSYRHDLDFESLMQNNCRLCVIDDFAHRPRKADILINPNFLPNLNQLYQHYRTGTKLLLGPKYVILPRAIERYRPAAETLRGGVKSIFVSFGGSQLGTPEIAKALRGIQMLDSALHVTVASGSAEVAEQFNELKNLRVQSFYNNLSEILLEQDIVIGASGSTTWERCFLGRPSVVVTLAENQIGIARAVHDFGAHTYIGSSEQTSESSYADALNHLISNPADRQRMHDAGLNLVPANGSRNIVSEVLAE